MTWFARRARDVLLVRAIVLALAGSLAPRCLADTIILTNGDHVTGLIQGVEPGKVIIATDYAGQVKIDWPRIAKLTADEETGLPIGLGFDTITGFSMLMQDNKNRAVFAKRPPTDTDEP